MSLKTTTYAAVRWTTLSSLGKALLMVFQMGLLARLLTPSDFGLMALVFAVMAFAQIFSDMGISNAIIHKQVINNESLSSLYWLNVLASSVLMFLLMLFSSTIADWYREPLMQPIIVLVSLSFLIVALGQQLRVLAEKKLLFKKIAVIELTASLLGFFVSITFAFAEGGVFSLVAGMLSSVAASTALTWFLLADGWRPLLRLKLSEIRSYLGFGAYTIGFSLTNTINMQADLLIGGRVLGVSNLGTYTLPKDLSLKLAMTINPIVTRVGLPVMAQAQGDRGLLRSIYLKTMLMTASVNFPLYFIIAAFAPEIVSVVFGKNWVESVPLLRILAFWGLFRSIGNPAGSLVYALGRADLSFWWSLGLMAFLIPAYWIGSLFGLTGLAIAVLVSMFVMPIPQWYIVIRPLCGAGFVEYFKQLVLPFSISALAALVSFFLVYPFDKIIFRLFIGVLSFGACYLALSYKFNRPWFSAVYELLLAKRLSKA